MLKEKMAIKYTQSTVATRPTFRTEKFGNLLSDTYQGEVHQTDSGKWNGWVMNWSRIHDSLFKFEFSSKASATRWTNARLKELGIK